MAKSVLGGRKQKGCCCCWVLEGKKWHFLWNQGGGEGSSRARKRERAGVPRVKKKKKLPLRLKVTNYFTCLSYVDTC